MFERMYYFRMKNSEIIDLIQAVLLAAVNSGNRKTWRILLPTFRFGSNIWGAMVVLAPYSGIFLLIFGLWLPELLGLMVVYPQLNEDFKMEECLDAAGFLVRIMPWMILFSATVVLNGAAGMLEDMNLGMPHGVKLGALILCLAAVTFFIMQRRAVDVFWEREDEE